MGGRGSKGQTSGDNAACDVVLFSHSRECRFGGSKYYHEKKKHLRDGPATVNEFSRWPVQLAQDLTMGSAFDAEANLRRRRLQNSLGLGVVVHSDYTGWAGPENAMATAGEGLKQVGVEVVVGGSGTADDYLVLWSGCDNDPRSQRLNAGSEQTEPLKRKHVHFVPSLLQKLNPWLAGKLEKMRPAKHDSREFKKNAYLKQLAFLEKHSDNLYDQGRAPCLYHPGCLCPVEFKPPSWRKPSERPLSLRVSGPTCTPWASNGIHRGYADENMESFYIYKICTKKSEADIDVCENSPNMPRELFGDAVEHKSHVVRLCFGPEDTIPKVLHSRSSEPTRS